jgi:hypothetical protein
MKALLLTAFAVSSLVQVSQPVPFRASTLAVRVDVLVTDGRKPVAGLTAQDFELRDNGIRQSIQLVDAADVPLHVVLALDVSASTTGSRLGRRSVVGVLPCAGRDSEELLNALWAAVPR